MLTTTTRRTATTTRISALAVARRTTTSAAVSQLREKLKNGPDLGDFIATPTTTATTTTTATKRTRGAKLVRQPHERLPPWLKVPKPAGKDFERIRDSVRGSGLATVCEEAKCPNIGECWGDGEVATATIMVLGDTCTRGCRFCAVKTSSTPPPPDPLEPQHVAETVSKWGVGYVVITSVDRDDLADGGAAHYAECVRRLKETAPHITVECLTGDFAGDPKGVKALVTSGLDVFAHNVETVERLTPVVRDRRAAYRQSLEVLKEAKRVAPEIPTKSSIMLGCGETEDEVRQTLKDLREAGVSIVTLGQYLQPTKRHMAIHRHVTPQEFTNWQKEGQELGFAYVASGPLVRSSYRAGEVFIKALLQKQNQTQ